MIFFVLSTRQNQAFSALSTGQSEVTENHFEGIRLKGTAFS
ncbi:hypothetical protein BRDCF_p400 [Bacteroidales bacterium CF]|nr:hypothetical protein BRDCF_p400 [Bacteroidales bacterium CF]